MDMDTTKTEATISTGRLLKDIRAARCPEEASAWHRMNGEPSLQAVLYHMMEQRSLSPKDMIQALGVQRSYYYHILSGVKKPSRNMILRIGFCLRADLKQMQRLLRLANASTLYPRVQRDALLIYAIQNKYSDVQVNELLLQSDLPPLYRYE